VVANPESLEETLSGRGEPSTFLSGPAALAMVKMEPLTQDGQDQEPLSCYCDPSWGCWEYSPLSGSLHLPLSFRKSFGF
jgi:hypothetical protein